MAKVNLDLHPAYRRMLVVSLALSVPENFLIGVAGPQAKDSAPINVSHSQFERMPIAGEFLASPVASRHCVHAGAKLTGRCCDGQGCLNPGNGQIVDSAISAYVPVLENTAYLTVSFTEAESQNLSKSLREGVCS